MQEDGRLTELTPEVMAQLSPAYWAGFNKIKLQAGPFSFTDHEYQWEPMASNARRVCYMKATQGGFTELEVLKTLHGLIYKRYKQGALYLFPTTDNVREFSKSRFAPLIQANMKAIGQWVKSQGKGTDTASLKKIHEAFLYLRGARLSTTIGMAGDTKESVNLRSIPVDRVVWDEVELMDESAVQKAIGRMGHSKVKEEVYISNPGLPDHGIDKYWQQSDQRYWLRKCKCGEWFSADLTFPDCVKVRSDGTGYVACPKCGKPVPFWQGDGTGKWERTIHDDSLMHGYHWSQLTSVYNDPADILKDFLDPPQGNIDDVYRLRLGLPHVQAEDKLSTGVVRECCGKDLMAQKFRGPCAMGVDVGKTFHVIIGIRTGTRHYEIVKLARVKEWNDIHDLARRFNVKSAVVDIRPYEDGARTFQKEESYRCFLCEYTESSTIGTLFNDASGIVKANRTEICDRSHDVIADRFLKIPREGTEVDMFIKQTCNAAKVLEDNKRTGQQIYRYRSVGTGGDHYRHALNYFLLASEGVRVTKSFGTTPPRQKYAKHDKILT